MGVFGQPRPLTSSRQRSLVELAFWSRLLCSHSSRYYLRDKITLPANGRASDAPQYRNLPHMGERIGNWTLKKSFYRCLQRLLRREEIIELLER